MRHLLKVVPLVILSACSWARATGDLSFAVETERGIEVSSERATLRFLNRGSCALEVQGAGETFVLQTAEDREVVLAGSHDIRIVRKGEGEGRMEVHFTADGRRSFVNQK
ncbi:MAG: hypothetical protein HYY18_05055 [Planctomycetes bacterium]|nr:hypothetical protein [Planctomycetota bacterium]